MLDDVPCDRLQRHLAESVLVDEVLCSHPGIISAVVGQLQLLVVHVLKDDVEDEIVLLALKRDLECFFGCEINVRKILWNFHLSTIRSCSVCFVTRLSNNITNLGPKLVGWKK